ncbi:MAG: VOC family protein [Sedimentisphaerales bacterium]|nr:VOC family protein [Sedimentisphaerales bacterium]
MPRVIHFEFPVDDPERATTFYENVFGWKIDKWDGPFDFWLVTTGAEGTPGIDGGFMRRQDAKQTTVNTVEVPSVDAYVEKIKASGGKVEVEKTAIPGVGWIAYGSDTEGNVFGLIEQDASAKPPGA